MYLALIREFDKQTRIEPDRRIEQDRRWLTLKQFRLSLEVNNPPSEEGGTGINWHIVHDVPEFCLIW